MQLRIGAVGAIFSKSLRLRSVGGGERNDVPSGQIMNLVSNDVERFLMTALFGSYAIWSPLQAVAILVLGIFIMGPAFAVGVAILMFGFVPMQFYLSKQFAVLRSKVASITDERVTLVSQAITGVRVMKMSGWEVQFQERIAEKRKREVRQIDKANRLKCLNEVMFFSTNVVVAIIIFVVHVFAFDGILTPRSVFTVMTLTNVLQIELTKHLSLGVMALSECWVSIRRIQQFLEVPELASPKIEAGSNQPDISHSLPTDGITAKERAIKLANVTCYWDINDPASNSDQLETSESTANNTIALSNISVTLDMSELTCIIGPVGSGKSALLHLLAGELLPSSGTVHRSYNSLSYATQDPWIMNGTIRENILMGRPALQDDSFYDDVVKACGLVQDFSQFVNGDATIVGDRGVQCSGGQRARIGLARAVYRDADVLLLDDPLSAVDSRVGRIIFYEAIQKLAVKRGKCVVLATHQHQFIGETQCIFMSNGAIKHFGSFSDCVAASNGKLHLVSHNSDNSQDNSTDEDTTTTKNQPTSDSSPTATDNVAALLPQRHDKTETDAKPNDAQAETKFTGIVSRKTFIHYAQSMGNIWLAAALLLVFILAQATALATMAAIGRWSEFDKTQQKSGIIVVIVLGLGAAVIVLAYVRSVSCFALTLRASKRLHNAMTSAVLRAKIVFFDTNPSGRILNRFSADVGTNDDLLPQTLYDFTVCSFLVIGSLVTAVTALPYILIVLPPLIWYFLRVRRLFVTTSRELKRFEGLARSPIFAKLSESISGVATIRSNDAVRYIKEKFEVCHDTHSRAFWSFLASSRWVGFRMDLLMFINCSVASLLAVLFSEQGWFGVDPVIFGLALSMLIQMGTIFQWTIRQSAEVVNLMVGVERVSEYSELEPEAPLSTATDESLQQQWPNGGNIECKDLVIRYRDSLPPSLRGISFNVASGTRVGVVGRTGSGKSTLVQALFRILEPEQGSITIDNVDIKSLGLHKLRKGMSVINQYPVLFSGCTIRENLDPFNTYSDEEIINALKDVQMITAVNSLPTGINSAVAKSGSNFSVGERQLLCLARAILQKSQILVLDEPTANVDGRTDKLLQEAVSKSFANATIISVAHRLDTIIDNDMILVLGEGAVLECGSPKELISRDGYFTKMVNDTGDELSKELKRRAMRGK